MNSNCKWIFEYKKFEDTLLLSNCVKREKSHKFKRDKNARNKFGDSYKLCVGDSKKFFFMCSERSLF